MSEPKTTAVVNIGTLLTGDLASPISEAESLLIDAGRITEIGAVAAGDADRVIDVGGATVG
jgi:enamidase